MRLAVVDLGTNTCRLLLAEAGGGITRMDARETNVVRLGEGVDANRRLLPEAAARTRRRLDDYGRRIREYRPDATLLLATSVLRDAVDGRAFLDDVSAPAGLTPRLIDGPTEARLAFRGATSRLDLPPSPVAVADIGGGSTELSVGHAGAGSPDQRPATSLGGRFRGKRSRRDGPPSPPSSSASTSGRPSHGTCLRGRPPDRSQWQAATDTIDTGLAQALPADVRQVDTLVGVAGTFTTLSAHLLGLREYDPWAVHGSRLSLDQIRATIARFRTMTSEQRGRLPGIQKGREDVILAGALLAERICVMFAAVEVTVSEADLLDGAALWLADGLPPLG